jgi:hypothetical protein
MHRQRAGRQVLPDQRAAARNERLCHELPAECPHRVLGGMRSDEQIVGDAVEVEYRQQFLEIRCAIGIRLIAGRHGLSFKR